MRGRESRETTVRGGEQQRMEKTPTVDGVSLEYRVEGDGEPVVLIHGALIADTYRPLVDTTALRESYRLITYVRRGHAGSTPAVGPVTMGEQAADCRHVLQHLGVERVHVVGHSYGGSIALQMAMEHPDLVRSLALLEPALLPEAEAEEYRERLMAAKRTFRGGDAVEVVEGFLRERCEGDPRALLDASVPGAFSQAVEDAETFFESEIAGLLAWVMKPSELRGLRQPTLSVLGERSAALWPRFGETHERLLRTVELCEGFVLPGATHLLQLENPTDLARALARFWARHLLDRG